MAEIIDKGELNSESFKPELADLFDRAVEFAQHRKSPNLSVIELLWSLLSFEASGKGSKCIAEDEWVRIRDAKKIITGNLKPGINLKKALEILHHIIIESRFENLNYFASDNWSDDFREIIRIIAEQVSDNTSSGDPVLPTSMDNIGYVHLAYIIYSQVLKSDDNTRQSLEDIFDLKSTEIQLERYLAAEQEIPESIFDDDNLRESLFDEESYTLVIHSLKVAGIMGFTDVKPLHLFLAYLDDREGFGGKVLIRCLPVNESLQSVQTKLEKMLSKGPGVQALSLQPEQQFFSEAMVDILLSASRKRLQRGLEKINKKILFEALLEHGGTVFSNTMNDVLKLDLKMIYETSERTEADHKLEIALPYNLFACAELTKNIRDGSMKKVLGRDQEVDCLARIFFRKRGRNVVIYGGKGVGKTAIANALSDAVVNNKIQFLKDHPVIYIDLTDMPEAEVKSKASKLFSFMEDNHKRIYIVDGFYNLFKNSAELCRSYLKKNRYYFLGIIDSVDYAEMNKSGENYNSYFNFLHIEELKPPLVIEILKQASINLKDEFDVEFEPNLFTRLVKMAGDFLIAETFPLKAIRVLELACSNVTFEAQNATKNDSERVITIDNIAREISAITGLPKDLILGTGEEMDHVDILSKSIIGQDHAVAKVAERLRLIQSGMVDKNKPPAIFMFIGLTGTGKTELASEIAKIYSNTRKLVTYSMENFKDKHNVSGIVGTSAGYVGFDEGGRLINDLNNDPYSVFLFDEVEKAHPDVWDPMLNLFDKGSIVDLRGRVAYGNKAFFILTSNLGFEKICSMLRKGCSMDEIQVEVLDLLYSAVHRDTREKCFRPELIGRIIRSGGIVVFNPLSLTALKRITRIIIHQICDEWQATREGVLIVEQDVIEHIAGMAFRDNEKSLSNLIDGSETGAKAVTYKGARVIFNLVDQNITARLAENIKIYHGSREVRVVMKGDSVEIICDSEELSLSDYKNFKKQAIVNIINEDLTALQDLGAKISDAPMRDVEIVREHLGEILTIIRE